MPQRQILGAVGGGFEACRSMSQRAKIFTRRTFFFITCQTCEPFVAQIVSELDGSSVVCVPGPSLEGPGFHSREGQFGKGNFLPVSSFLLLHRLSLFWCCFDMSSPEDTQTTEASQESQESQKSSRNKETTRSTADCLQWAIGEGIGDHLSLTESQGESQNGKLNCNLCAVRLSTKGAILKDHVLGKNVKQPDGSYARKPGTHARKAGVCPLVPPQAAEATPQQPPTIIVNVPAPQPEPAPAPQKKAATAKQHGEGFPVLPSVVLTAQSAAFTRETTKRDEQGPWILGTRCSCRAVPCGHEA